MLGFLPGPQSLEWLRHIGTQVLNGGHKYIIVIVKITVVVVEEILVPRFFSKKN